MTTEFLPGSLEAECIGGLDWAWHGLHECIKSTRDKVSITFGVLSIIAWIMFSFPQLITSCIKKNLDKAISKYLLIFWLFGDLLNFIGAFLIHLEFLQKVVAYYRILIDIILIIEYMYYYLRHKYKSNKFALEYIKENVNDVSSTEQKRVSSVILGVVGLTAFYGPSLIPSSTEFVSFAVQGRQLLQMETTTDPFKNFIVTTGEKIGYAMGVISTVMYVFSRVPQIVRNFNRKSTEGLSVYLFLFSVFGNTFYGLYIFTKSTDVAFLIKLLPWILGSVGILAFDFIILVQFFWYRNNAAIAGELVLDVEKTESIKQHADRF